MGIVSASADAQEAPVLKHVVKPHAGFQGGARLGGSAAINDAYLVLGAPFHDNDGGSNSGAVKVFDSDSGALLHVILNPSPAPDEQFGCSVAVNGTRIVVGAFQDSYLGTRTGRAYVYNLETGTPVLETKLGNPEPAFNDQFGWTVAISGSRVVVGEAMGGNAYLFDLAGEAPETAVLKWSKPESATVSYFGRAVALEENRLIIGGSGAAFLYDVTSESPFTPIATLNPPGLEPGSGFGLSLAASGSRLVVGAFAGNVSGNKAGIAYVFDLTGEIPTFVTALNNPDPSENARFAWSVAISGTRVIVGSHWNDTGAANAGAAYLYDLAGATVDEPIAVLSNPTPEDEDQFGFAVAVSEQLAVVGASGDDTLQTDAGSAYIYDLGGENSTTPILTVSDPGPSTGDQFGRLVSISGRWMAVGAAPYPGGKDEPGSVFVYDLASAKPALACTLHFPRPWTEDPVVQALASSGKYLAVGIWGAVYIYDLESEDPTHPVATLSAPDPVNPGSFGSALAFSGTRLVVGAPYYAPQEAGAAFVYEIAGGQPTAPVLTLFNPAPARFDTFGGAVAISGTQVVVSAMCDDEDATNAGMVYLYDLAGENPAQPTLTLHNPSPTPSNDSYGTSVAVSGPFVVVSAPLDDTDISNSGEVYVYNLAGAVPATPFATLINPHPGGGWHFGESVAISGTRVVVGNPGTHAAYAYDVSSDTPEVAIAVLERGHYGSLGSSLAIDGGIAVIGAPLDDLVVRDKGAVLVFAAGPGAPTVEAKPVLDLLITGARLRGSVNPNDLETVYSFKYRLAGTNGPVEFFEHDSQSPLNHIAPVEVGVALSALSPATTYEFWLTATNSAGSITSGPVAFTTLPDTINPVVTPPQGGFSPLVISRGRGGIAPIPTYLSQALGTDNVAVVSYAQNPPIGTMLPTGDHIVTITATDAAGNAGTTSFVVTVTPPADPVFAALHTRESAVPEAGVDSRIPVDSKWFGFGVPAVNASGAVAFLGKWRTPAGNLVETGVFVNDTLIAKAGEPVPGIAGATFRIFKDPVIDENGNVAFIAGIKGGDVKSNRDTVVVSTGRTGQLEVLARESEDAPGVDGAQFQTFASVSIQGGGTLFTATLRKGSGRPKLKSGNDSGAWWQPAGEADVQLLVRAGNPGWETGGKIKSFQLLKATGGSPGHGRGQAGGASAVLQVTMTGGRQAHVFASPETLNSAAEVGDLLASTVLPAAAWGQLGMPSFGDFGRTLSVLGTMQVDGDEIVKANARGIFLSADSGISWEPLARTGTVAPGLDGIAVFSDLKDPVNSSTDSGVAFLGSARGGIVRGDANSGIWWQPEGGNLSLVAREGDHPPGAPDGATWKSFTSLALPGGDAGPLFTAQLSKGAGGKRGPGGITAANYTALYATDAEGIVRELLRENQPLLGRIVKTFNVLKAVSGSAGTTRAFNSAGDVVVQVTFTDSTTAIVSIQLP